MWILLPMYWKHFSNINLSSTGKRGCVKEEELHLYIIANCFWTWCVFECRHIEREISKTSTNVPSCKKYENYIRAPYIKSKGDEKSIFWSCLRLWAFLDHRMDSYFSLISDTKQILINSRLFSFARMDSHN